MPRMKYVMLLVATCALGFPLEVLAAPMVGITVAPGDTLRALCRQHLEDPDSCREVYRLNRMRNPDLIRPGQRVMVPADLLRGIPAEGVVSFVKGDVRYYRAEGEEGRPPQVGESLEEGGRIETGRDGSVEVTFGDGSSFFVKPDSVLSLVRSRQKGDEFVLRNLFLKTGRVLSRIRKATGHEQRYNIRTPSAVAGARGTEFRVSVDEEETTRSEVLAGTVAVEAKRREVMLHEGEGTGVRKGEIPAPPRPLLPPPLPLVSPVYKSEPVRISFSTVAGASALRATLARDVEIRDVVRERVVPAGEGFEVSGLVDGSYFLQATSIDDKGLEGKLPAPVPVVIRLNPMPPNVEAPRDGAEYRGTTVVARWLRVGGAVGYRIQIAGDHSFTSPLVDQRVEGVEHDAELGYGTYYFRVASVAPDGFQGEWSDALSFSLVKPPPTPSLAGAPEADGKQMRIRVRDAGKGMTYRFQVARDEQFTDLLQDTKVEVPELAIPRPNAGTYYVRTSCLDAKGNEGNFSPPQSFVIEPRFPYGILGVVGGIVGLIIGLVL